MTTLPSTTVLYCTVYCMYVLTLSGRSYLSLCGLGHGRDMQQGEPDILVHPALSTIG